MASETADTRNRVNYVLNGRPHFFADPAVDKLLAMTAALIGEVCVLRDRLDTHERLAAERGLYDATEIDNYAPDEATLRARESQRKATIERVMKVLTEEVARLRDA